MIAIYEQEGTVESIIDSFKTLLPLGVLNFPTMDKTRGRFAECVYRPTTGRLIASTPHVNAGCGFVRKEVGSG